MERRFYLVDAQVLPEVFLKVVRTKEMLLSLGRAELVRMRDEDPNCEVVCHFCHSKYQYDLNALLAEYDAQAAQAAEAEHPVQ